MGFIYKITNNINNKIYIGKTNRDISIRFQEHIDSSNSINSPSYNSHLHRAFRKYGIENFSIDKIEEVSEELINEREKYWIKYYNSYNSGYNMTLGGEGNLKYTDEEVLELWNEGYSLAEIERELGFSHGNVNNRIKQLGITKEEIDKRAQEKLMKINSHPVLQFDKNGIFIKEWNTAEEAARCLRLSSGSNIRSCCRGKIKTAYGFVWKRKT